MDNRTNYEWLSSLRSQGELQEKALSDLAVIIQNGLPHALSKWIQPNDPRFPSLTQEVTQETLLRVLAQLDSFQGRSRFTTWVYTIAVRIALTELRRAKWREVSLDEIQMGIESKGELREMPDQSPGIEKSIENKEILKMLQQVILNELTSKQQKALLAVAVQGMPLAEVARRMETERNALYKLLHDARLKLKKYLEKHGLSPLEILAMFEH